MCLSVGFEIMHPFHLRIGSLIITQLATYVILDAQTPFFSK